MSKIKTETLEEFLANGGAITKCPPEYAKGYLLATRAEAREMINSQKRVNRDNKVARKLAKSLKKKGRVYKRYQVLKWVPVK